MLDASDVSAETADHSNGLVATMSSGAILCTGIHTGTVRVRAETRTGPPEDTVPGPWEEIIQAGIHAPHGRLRVDTSTPSPPFPC